MSVLTDKDIDEITDGAPITISFESSSVDGDTDLIETVVKMARIGAYEQVIRYLDQQIDMLDNDDLGNFLKSMLGRIRTGVKEFQDGV